MNNATSNTVGSPHSQPARSKGSSRIIVVIVGVVFLLLVLYVCITQFGRVEGVEFSSATFKRRHFRYHEIPLLGMQITPIKRNDRTSGLANYLTNNSLVQAQASQGAPQWDIVRVIRGGVISDRGDAEILCTYLDMVDAEGGVVWLQWSKDNAPLAKVLRSQA